MTRNDGAIVPAPNSYSLVFRYNDAFARLRSHKIRNVLYPSGTKSEDKTKMNVNPVKNIHNDNAPSDPFIVSHRPAAVSESPNLYYSGALVLQQLKKNVSTDALCADSEFKFLQENAKNKGADEC